MGNLSILRLVTTGIAFACASSMASAQPADLAPLKVTTKTDPSPGFLYLAPNCRVSPRPYESYLGVYNVNGGVVKVNRTQQWPFEYKVLPDGRLGYSELIVFNGSSAAAGVYVVDTNLNIIESLDQKRGYLATQHDFHQLPNGNRVILGAEDVIVDMSKIVPGGNPAAIVVQAVIQEIDRDGRVLTQWKSLDHIPITDSYEDLTAASIRYIHNNSLWIDDDGNWLVSLRHTSTIIKVNKRTGQVMWTLGGKRNEFTFVNDHEENAPTYFSYQHDVRRLPNGNITLFDNGTQHNPKYSRAVEYKIDETTKTATMVWDYRHIPDIFVTLQGGVQTLPDGHRVIGWGSAANEGSPGVTEVDSTGTVVFEAYYPKQMFVYRATKLPYWPPGKPSATIPIENVLENQTYNYKNVSQNSGVHVTYKTLQSPFFYNNSIVRRYEWAPQDPIWPEIPPDAFKARVEIELEGIENHLLDVRFNVDTLGIARNPEHISVYYRDTAASKQFSRLPTTFDADNRELVVTGVQAGEFAFATPVSYVSSSPATPLPTTPLLLSPIHGDTILVDGISNLRVSPQGVVDEVVVEVGRTAQMSTALSELRTEDDAMAFTPDEQGMYYWRAKSVLNQEKPFLESAWSTVDSFYVGSAYVNISKPDSSVTWEVDNAYIISWTTNLPGTIRLEFVRDGQENILIADSVKASAKGYLWKVPVSVPQGSNYRVRATSLEQGFAGTTDLNGADIRIGTGTSVHEEITYTEPEFVETLRVFGLNGEQVHSKTVRSEYKSLSFDWLPTGTWWLAMTDSAGKLYVKQMNILH